MKIIAKYIHGSEDSLDVDTYYIVDKVPSFQESKIFCDSIKNENANLLSLDESGHVNACYKGTVDECNNSLYDTYNLHRQQYPLLISSKVERDICLKCIRAIRIILSHLSRTQYRKNVKSALRSSMTDRINVLKSIPLQTVNFDGLENNQSGKDILKVIAFQIGQTMALINGIELYTKMSVAEEYDELLPFLYRQQSNIADLNTYKNILCDTILEMIGSSNNDSVTFLCGETYNLKTEIKI
ncbi:MAG: hypothetical protein [Wendovervirus sonii]|uniref:Uncharacterized protein n=1 Tax=phage Lak_Megaphage_Sonny TaxID=3109229 RepID=A0ABZ0Z4Q2_9CAUD|nr:MAG: hypothetical protein [phage Lak_Megaphage_Sonny]